MGVNNKLVLISILLLSFVFVLSLGFSNNLVNAVNGTNNSAYVFVYSSPMNASVFINSVYIGNTPTNATVLEGYATILFKKDGYYDAINFTYLSSLYTNYVSSVLQPLNTTNLTYGSLYVVTNPSGANVYVDNVYKGLSPLTISNVATGYRSVYATKTGYVPSATYFKYVYANNVTNVNIILQINQTNASTGSVWMWTPANGVDWIPTYSNKYLDGIYKGYGNVWIQNVTPGTHTARATYPGYENYTTTINVVAGQMTNVSLPLTKINTTVTTYNCTDTDQSYYPTINIYTKGTSLTYACNSGGCNFNTATDYCISGATLIEYYCSNKTTPYMVMNVTCAYGCSNGACLMSTGGGECDEPGSCPIEILPKSRIRSSPDRSSNLIAILAFVAAIALFFLLITKKKKAKASRKSAIKRSSKKKRI